MLSRSEKGVWYVRSNGRGRRKQPLNNIESFDNVLRGWLKNFTLRWPFERILYKININQLEVKKILLSLNLDINLGISEGTDVLAKGLDHSVRNCFLLGFYGINDLWRRQSITMFPRSSRLEPWWINFFPNLSLKSGIFICGEPDYWTQNIKGRRT